MNTTLFALIEEQQRLLWIDWHQAILLAETHQSEYDRGRADAIRETIDLLTVLAQFQPKNSV